ncbi:MAG TPA: DUF819 family protein [Gemmatimonadales bacterium]|nr:DUF819 family protein [Gemmatimonadales bacterium]
MQTQAPAALLSDPMLVFAYLGGLLAIIFWVSGFPALKKFFTVIPPLIFAYFVPTVSTALGITPLASPAYDWIIRFLLPVALFLLVITIDLPALAKMGWMALVMMLAGTVGIIIGGPVAFLAVGHWLPDQAWTGLAALSGSWIGGAANMMAIAQSVGTPDSILGPIIVVDTAVGYGWMGVLLFLSAFQHRFDRWSGADTTAIEETNAHLSELQSHRHPIEVRDLAIILGLAFAAAVAAVYAGQRMPDLGDPTIISKTTWAVLFVVTGALMLSLTPARKLEEAGASKLGFMALYFLIAAIGARADLHAVLQTPMFLLAGMIWMAVHIAVLFGVARLVRAPLFFIATGSMANIGGAASAPIVAGVYHPALAPVGVLMGVSGYILGIYGALGCAWILGQLGG